MEEASSAYGEKTAFPTTEPPSDSLRSPVQIGINISPATPEIEVNQVDGEIDRRQENGMIVGASLSDERVTGSLGVGEQDIEKEAEKERERELGTRRGMKWSTSMRRRRRRPASRSINVAHLPSIVSVQQARTRPSRRRCNKCNKY